MYKTELLDFDKILKTSPLFVDYTRDFQAVKDLFYQDPRDLEDLTVAELLEGEDTQLLKALELLEALPEE